MQSQPRPTGGSRGRAYCVLALLALVATTIPLQGAGAAVRRPDLQIASITNPPARIARGESFAARTVVRNAGKTRAGASKVRFYLSRDRKKGKGDKRLGQMRNIPRLQPGKTSKGNTTLKPPATLATGSYYVIACADDLKKVRESKESNNCRASRGFDFVPGPSSSDKIDAAVEAGEITPEQGLVYETFAAFGDSRLPSEYRGSNNASFHGGSLATVSSSFDSLTPAAKGAVTPFLMAPAYPNTWEELSTTSSTSARTTQPAARTPLVAAPPMHPSPLGEEGWFFYEHQHARIWFREDNPAHEAFAGQIFDALPKVHGDLTGLMGQTPLSDAGPHPFVDTNGNPQVWGDGGNGQLDIYVINIAGPDGGLTITYPPGCTARPSFIVLDPRFHTQRATHARDVLAHEFMHVLQYTYQRSAPCKDYQDLDEATATWAIDYVYSTDNFEHDWNTYVWKNWIPSLAQNDYDAWNFFMYLEHAMSPDAIPGIYAAMASAGPWQAVDSVVTGGLADTFPDFLRKAWNQLPENSNFMDWDSIPWVPELATDGSSGRGPKPVALNQPFEMKMELPALGHAYYDVTFPDDQVVKIKYENTLASNSNIDIRAFARLEDGTWLDQDWSGDDEVVFCRDKPTEDVQELVIIVANTQFADLEAQADATNKITTKGDCLPEAYSGSFSGRHQAGDLPGFTGPTYTFSGNVTFERYTGPCKGEWWCYDGDYQTYKASAGSASWSVSGGSPCSVEGAGSLSLVPFDTTKAEEAFLLVRKRPKPGRDYPHYFGAINKQDTIQATYTCEGSDPVQADHSYGAWWNPDQEDNEAHPDGSLSDSETTTDPESGNSYSNTWSFAPQS